PIAADITLKVAYLTAARFTQIPWICKQNGENVIMTTDMADLSTSKTSTTTSLVFLTGDESPNYYQFDDNFLTTASSTNSITSNTVVLVNQQSTAGSDITASKLLIMSSNNFEVWLTGFGAMYVKKKDVAGKIGSILWNTHTNVKRTTDQVVKGVLYNKGTTRLMINDMGHILIQVDNMFNNIGVTPYNFTTYDVNTRQTTVDSFTTVWSNVPKHMMFQIGTKRVNGYTFVLEEFPATSGTTWNLILYDGGGSKVWCATSTNCNWSGSSGYRFPPAYLLPTDFPTDAVDPQKDDASYPHNYLNPAYNLTVVNSSVHISENQRCGPILTSGQGLTSPNGRFKLILDWSGNLIFNDGVRTMWETFTANVFFAQPPYSLQLSNRGSLYLSDTFGGLLATTLVQQISLGNSCDLFRATDSTEVIGGMILTISGTGRLSFIDADATNATWQNGTLTIRDSTGLKTYNTTCAPPPTPVVTPPPVATPTPTPPVVDHVPADQEVFIDYEFPTLICCIRLQLLNLIVLELVVQMRRAVTWWNRLPNGSCYLKQTDKSDANPWYTWFVNATGAIAGNINTGVDITSFASTSPSACHQVCRSTSGCQWIAYQYISFNQQVQCYIKKAIKAPGSGKVTGYSMKPRASTEVPGFTAMAGIDVAGDAFNTLQNLTSLLGCSQQCQGNIACGDIFGFDLANGQAAAPSPSACIQRCTNTANCNWIQYIPYDDGSVYCYLKQAAQQSTRYTGYYSTGGIVTRPDMDIPCYDVQAVFAYTANDCGHLCASDNRCAWATFIPGMGCYMKGPDASNPNAYMQFRGSIEPFVGNIPGYDTPNGYFVASTPAECHVQCVNNPQCDWVNFDMTNAASNQVPCWLKTGPTFSGRPTVYSHRSPTLNGF
ncbi:hypothetical protein HDU76_003753, partial [Blyttiomyces sp. JEL0837]